jgi:HAE1 family hydrophobic/amphiphilic exporter-1
VTYRNGAPVHLGDLGQVLDDVQNNRNASWFNGRPGIILAIQRQPGTNTVAVAEGVRRQVDRLRNDIPAGVNIQILYDRSQSIQDSVHDVKFTLLLTLVLVVMVIFLFLRNLSATVIPSLALPMSIVGTFSVMYLMGYSLDNLSLMALTLCVGFVVDDAIVMLENIVRHMEMGKPPMQAAFDGSREIGFTILSMTLSLTAVFIPILFMGGILGRLFHEFAVTIGVAILVSGFVSLTLTPMLGSRFLRPSKEAHHGKVYAWSEHVYDRVLGAYERSLAWVMGRRRGAMVFSAGILVATVGLFVIVPKGFLPSEDNGSIQASTEAAEGISYEAMVAHQREVADIVGADPNVEAYMSFVGGGFGGGGNTRSCGSCPSSCRASQGCGCSCRTPHPSASAAASRRACISTRSRARTSTRCTPRRGRSSAAWTRCPSSPTSRRTSRSATRRWKCRSTASGPPPWA